jgi:hypothetical protein
MAIERRGARCDITHRRGFLVASVALGTSLLLPQGVAAAQVRVLQGGVKVNGKKATRSTAIRAGDTIETARGARLVFVVGEDAFLMRGESKLLLEHNANGKSALVSGLRLLTGALLAVFSPGARRIETPTVTAGIRGTGVYIEASPGETYFCDCYGEVALRDRLGAAQKTLISGYHTATVITAKAGERAVMRDADLKNHSDEELIMLESLVGRVSPIVKRNQKIKEASQPENGEQVPGPKQETVPAQAKPEASKEKAAAKQQPAAKEQPPAKEQPAAKEQPSAKEQPAVEEQPLEAPKSAPAAEQPPAKAAATPDAVAKPKADAPVEKPKPTSRKTQPQKQGKVKPKPAPEAPPAEPAAPVPEPEDPLRNLGPAPMPAPEPQPAGPEYRLPPARLE